MTSDQLKLWNGTPVHRLDAALDGVAPNGTVRVFAGDVDDVCQIADPKGKISVDLKALTATAPSPGFMVVAKAADVRAIVAEALKTK